MKQLMLMIGTRKGSFLAFSDLSRKSWELKGPFFKGVEVSHFNMISNSSPVICMTGKSSWWGSKLSVSRDFGTQGGQILASSDEGDHWQLLFNWLPPVYSLEAEVIER